jgi:tetratricopeptide (TPR) repeat protein
MKIRVFAIFLSLITAGIISPQLLAQEESTGRYGKDSVTCIMNISLYREFYKQWKASGYKNETIKDVISPWRWVFLNCPKGTQNTYIDGVKIISYLIDKAESPELKEKYIDTLMMVYDQRIEYFNKEGYVLGRKGVDLFSYRPSATKDIYRDLKKSIEIEGNASKGPVVVYYMNSAVKMAKEGKADSSIIFDAYDISSGIVDYNLKKYADKPKDNEKWMTIQNNIELILEPFATCKDLIAIYRKKFNENPEDLEMLQKVTALLDEKDCQQDPFYFETTKKLYELEPSPKSAYLIGKMLMNEEKYAEAIDYFKEGEKTGDSVITHRSFLYIAQAYRTLNNFPSARTYALKSVAYDPYDGEPYILIGDMYAASAKECGDNDLSSRAAYWAAVDKYYKAKKVDPDLAEEAAARIASYSVYFPSAKTIFFYSLNEGDTYRVECWINEDTRVRASKQ